MDLILNIFKQLGADSTFFIQLVIFIFAFMILKFVLFEKLKKVIEHREDHTVGLAERAKVKEEEAQEIASEYQIKIDETQAVAQNKLQVEKIRVLEGQRSAIKKAEDKSVLEIEKEKKNYSNELQKMSDQLMSSSNDIADQLVDKLTK